MEFSDDMRVPEEAVDLGGPGREFLLLLIEALPLSPMFEGEEGKMNFALDTLSMVGFLSPTLFSCLVDGPDLAKPVLEDVADSDLREKIKRVEDLIVATEPLQEYLANAGCLRPLRRLEDKDLLIHDILMFQVIHRVRGPFERFQDGLRTLEVLDKIQAYKESFRTLLCWSSSVLTADLLDSLFTIRLSPAGSNKRHAEAVRFKHCVFQENMDFALGNTHGFGIA
ncbi:suppressor of tumorigenicity protein 14 [Sarotherodon galilaeus]